MHLLYEFCKNRGISTRVVESVIKIEFSLDNGSFLEEYYQLGAMQDRVTQWTSILQEKKEDALILEIILELYKKVTRLEKKIMQEEAQLITLDKHSNILALGHGVLFIEDRILEAEKSYYLRFVLPSFSDKIISVFAMALNENILQITKMHPKDVQDFDNFIAITEMATIRAQKCLKGQENDK